MKNNALRASGREHPGKAGYSSGNLPSNRAAFGGAWIHPVIDVGIMLHTLVHKAPEHVKHGERIGPKPAK